MNRKLVKKLENIDEITQEELDMIINGLNKNKKYGLVWEHHPEDVDLELKDGTFSIEELADKRIMKDGDGRKNLLLEGDNLHSLMMMKEAGITVDVIYIDPPYNILNEKGFKYNDKRIDNNDSYRHSKWISFMGRRLNLARDLLMDDGVIFISIDEHEQSQLKLLMDEIFGEENHLMTTVRKTKSMTGDDGTGINVQHDFLVFYARNKLKVKLQGKEKDFKSYSNPDDDPNGPWTSGDPTAKSGSDGTNFPIRNPYTGKVDYPSSGRYWAFNKSTFEKYLDSGRIKYKKEHKENERGFIFKRYKENLKNTHNPFNSLVFSDNLYLNSNGTTDLNSVIENVEFSYPKPVKLIKTLIKSHPNKDITVLDFFAGSGTTGQAVMELNEEDDGNRRFILCTNNENNICEEITYERNKRVITGKWSKSDVVPIPNNLAYYKVDIINKNEVSFEEKQKADINNEIYMLLMEDELNMKENNEDYGILENKEVKVLFIKKEIVNNKIRSLEIEKFDKLHVPIVLNSDKFFKDLEESKVIYY